MGKRKKSHHKRFLWKLVSHAIHGQWHSLLACRQCLAVSSLRSTAPGEVSLFILHQVSLLHGFFTSQFPDEEPIPEPLPRPETARIILPVYFAFAHLTLLRENILLGKDSIALRHSHSYASNLLLSASLAGAERWDPAITTSHSSAALLLPRIRSQMAWRQSVDQHRVSSRQTFVLGMHRSGTSALTGMLCGAGFTPPSDLMPPTEANPKGYWESWEIHLLNDRFLRSMGASWRGPRDLPLGWEDAEKTFAWHEELLQTISRLFSNHANPIIKDPRFCILLSGLRPWLECPDTSFRFILPVRDPLEVSKSLELREKVPPEEGINLWLAYVFSSELHSRGHPRLLLDFNQIIEAPDQVLERCHALDASGDSRDSPAADLQQTMVEDAAGFIDAHLRHQHQESLFEELEHVRKARITPYRIATLLYRLMTLPRPEDPGVHERIDRLRAYWEMLADAP